MKITLKSVTVVALRWYVSIMEMVQTGIQMIYPVSLCKISTAQYCNSLVNVLQIITTKYRRNNVILYWLTDRNTIFLDDSNT